MSTPAAGKRVAKNLLITILSQVISWGLTFTVTLFLPRYAGDAGLGRLAFAGSLAAVFGVFIPLGTGTVIVKGVARDPECVGELVSGALAIRMPLALLAMLLVAVFGVLLGYDSGTRALLLAAASGMLVGTVNDTLIAALQGLERLPRQNATALAERFLNSAATIGLILAKAPLWAITAVGAVSNLIAVVINLTALWPAMRGKFWAIPQRETLRGLVKGGLPYMGISVFRALYGQTDPIVLRLLTNDATVGWYAAAFRLVGTTLFLPNAITTVLLPPLARAQGEGDMQQFARLARRMLRLVMLFGMPLALLPAFLPEQILALMHYPPSFAAAAPVLRVGGAATLLYFAAIAVGTIVVAGDRQTGMFRASMAAAGIGIPACFLGTLVTHRLWHNGAVGAIASDVLLEVFLLACYLRVLPFPLLDREEVIYLGRCALASAPAVAVLYVLTGGRAAIPVSLGLWAALPAALVYGLACIPLGCIDRDMATRLWEQIPGTRRPRPVVAGVGVAAGGE